MITSRERKTVEGKQTDESTISAVLEMIRAKNHGYDAILIFIESNGDNAMTTEIAGRTKILRLSVCDSTTFELDFFSKELSQYYLSTYGYTSILSDFPKPLQKV